eukprot:1163094-Rhodomonas_salina.2
MSAGVASIWSISEAGCYVRAQKALVVGEIERADRALVPVAHAHSLDDHRLFVPWTNPRPVDVDSLSRMPGSQNVSCARESIRSVVS